MPLINHPLAAVLERVRLTPKLFWLTESVLLILAGAFFAGGGWIGYLSGSLLIISLIWAMRWYETGGHAELHKNQRLQAAEWDSDELIKSKLIEQGHHENPSLTSRLMHGIIRFDRFLPAYEIGRAHV